MAHTSTSFSSHRQSTSGLASLQTSGASLTSPQLPVGNTSAAEMDAVTEEINNFLTRLKCKKDLKDEDPDACKSALMLMSPEVSRVMASLVGVDKMGLKAETRELLAQLEKFFKEYLAAVNVSNGSKALELLQELVCNPDFVVFQQLLCNQPENWIALGLPVIHDNERKKALLEQLQKETKEIYLRRKELAKSIKQRKKELRIVRVEHAKKNRRMSLDKMLKLGAALETCQSEQEELEAASKNASSVTENDVTELLDKFDKLNERHKAAQETLAELSCENALPPDIVGATQILTQRKEYMEELIAEISDHTEELSLNSTFNTTMSLDSTI